MIEIKHLSKHYGDVKAVNGIDFTVQKGEVLGLLGPNGAGKSTTIRMLCCYTKPTEGTIRVKALDILEHPQEIKKMIGYLSDSAPLYGDMIVYDYLRYVAKIRLISPQQQHERILEIASTCVIREVMHKNIGELSKGYKQRVGLAHALIGDPDILVLDEPTAGLDPNQIVEIRRLIKNIGEQKTVILCSHILSEVEATCDRVIIINRGKVVADGSAESLKKGYVKDKTILLEFSAEGVNESEVEAVLKGIHQMDRVELLSQKEEDILRYHLTYQGEQDRRSEVYEAIKNKNWPLLTLYQERNSLENVFRTLTQGEANS